MKLDELMNREIILLLKLQIGFCVTLNTSFIVNQDRVGDRTDS